MAGIDKMFVHPARLWWIHLILAMGTGIIVVDHVVPPEIVRLAVVNERAYQERIASHHTDGSSSTSTINTNVLRLSDGSALQLSSVGDWISAGDTIELQRTAMLDQPLLYRKRPSRMATWFEVDSARLEYRIYPYVVFACAVLLLFRLPWETVRWSLQAALIVMLVCWMLVLIGTSGLAHITDLT